MFHFKNLTTKFGNYSYSGNYVNKFKFVNLVKHECYPHFNKEIIKNVPTYLIINYGKLMINMNKFNKKNKTIDKVSIFAENDTLFKTDEDCDIVLTNQKYIFIIAPCVNYTFYSYDNTSFQMFYKSYNSYENTPSSLPPPLPPLPPLPPVSPFHILQYSVGATKN